MATFLSVSLGVAVQVSGQTAANGISAGGPATTMTAADVATEIVKVAGQSDAAIRRAAALNILRAGTPEGVNALVAVLTTENNVEAKLAVCRAIVEARLQVPEFIVPLQGLLESRDTALSKAAAAALALYADPQVQARLASHRREQERRLLMSSVQRLMDMLYEVTRGQAEREQLLAEWLRSDLALMRAEALSIVQETLRQEGTRPSAGILELVRSLVYDPDEQVRLRVVVLLRDLGHLEDAARLRSMLTQEESAAVREAVYKALGKLADPLSIEDCIRGLQDASESVAAAAADSLGKLCERGAGQAAEQIARVVAALEQRTRTAISTDQLRLELVEAMADIAVPAFAQTLLMYAQDTQVDPAVRQAGVRGLGRLGQREYLPVLVARLTEDPHPGVREVAAEGIGALGDQPEHLLALAGRLDPKIEPVAAVQTQAWRSYVRVFERLSFRQQQDVLNGWRQDDPRSLVRRAELLGRMESQAGARIIGGSELMHLREELGQALLATGNTQEALAAWMRALEACPPDQTDAAARLAGRIVDALLREGNVEGLIALVTNGRLVDCRELIAASLVRGLESLAATSPAAASPLLSRLLSDGQLLLGAGWDEKLRALAESLPPATAPATGPAATLPSAARDVVR